MAARSHPEPGQDTWQEFGTTPWSALCSPQPDTCDELTGACNVLATRCASAFWFSISGQTVQLSSPVPPVVAIPAYRGEPTASVAKIAVSPSRKYKKPISHGLTVGCAQGLILPFLGIRAFGQPGFKYDQWRKSGQVALIHVNLSEAQGRHIQTRHIGRAFLNFLEMITREPLDQPPAYRPFLQE